MKEAYVTSYANHFRADELDAMAAFFSSELGKKYIRVSVRMLTDVRRLEAIADDVIQRRGSAGNATRSPPASTSGASAIAQRVVDVIYRETAQGPVEAGAAVIFQSLHERLAVATVIESVLPVADRLRSGDEAARYANEVTTSIRSSDSLLWLALRSYFIDVYAREFSISEMESMHAFFINPAGQRYLNANVDLLKEQAEVLGLAARDVIHSEIVPALADAAKRRGLLSSAVSPRKGSTK
jgi:hypothetical protein